MKFQQMVGQWLVACFGEDDAASVQLRAQRFLEESLELGQAAGVPIEHALQLVHYVYGRPVGDPPQEVGGTMVTLAGLCSAMGIDMDGAAWVEICRCWANVEKIRAKNATKKADSALPGVAPDPAPCVHGVTCDKPCAACEEEQAEARKREERRQAAIVTQAWSMYEQDTEGNLLAAPAWHFLSAPTRIRYLQMAEQALIVAGKI